MTEDQQNPALIGVVSVSDRASRGEYEDLGGPAVEAYLGRVLVSPWKSEYRLIPDEPPVVRDTLLELSDNVGCCLVITTGGTGPSPRDITPEATSSILEKELPGFGEVMRAVSLQYVPTAILSRQVAGVRGHCLFLNLPGSPKAVGQCLDAVFAAIPDCVDLIGGPALETDPAVVKAYRPHG